MNLLLYGLHVAVIVIVVAHVLVARRPARTFRGILAIALALVACLAIGNYTKFGKWPYGSYINGWEFYHYYMGSKYAPEIGYTNLYAATLVADVESGRKFSHKKKTIRNLESGRYVPAIKVLAENERYKALFSEKRWADFVRDIRYFKGKMVTSRWNGTLRDKGYNATPVWGMTAGIFSNAVSTESAWGMTFLALLDPLLITAAMAGVWWAFGYRVALLMVIFMGTHMVMSHSHLKGAFLRTDWAMCLVLSVCMIKKGHFKTAGALTGYAALSRIFPAVFAFGIGAKLLCELVRTRSLDRRYTAYLISFAATIGLFVLASVCYHRGLGVWTEFAAKIGDHHGSFSPWRVGFKHIFIGAYKYREAGEGTLQGLFEARATLWWAIQVAMLGLCVFLVRNLEDYEAAAFSFVPVFFLVAPTYYYYIMLLVPFLFFAPSFEKPSSAIGLILMFLSSMVAYQFYSAYGRELPLFYALSMMALLVVIYMMAMSCFDALKIAIHVRLVRYPDTSGDSKS